MSPLSLAARRTTAAGAALLRVSALGALLLLGHALQGMASPDTPGPLPGRLFTTPAQRAALDHPGGGATGSTGAARQRTARPAALPAPPDQRASLQGFVLRSDGRNSYWVAPEVSAASRNTTQPGALLASPSR